MSSASDRRRSERYPTASIPVQLADVAGELIDLSLSGAAVIHRSPVKNGVPVTLIFPSYGGIYIACEVLRSIVQVRRTDSESEYVFRSAIAFSPLAPDQEPVFREFLTLQIARLEQARREAGESNVDRGEPNVDTTQ